MIIKRTKQKSSRNLRVAEIIKKAVSEVLLKNELPLNPNFQFPLSVVSTEMSSDLRIAYIYVNTHEYLEKEEIINRKNKITGAIKNEGRCTQGIAF